MLSLADDWVWDSWIADDGDKYHLFFLKAPKALGDPRLRHVSAVIGHASSRDLVDWTIHPDALRPSPTGWDDLAIWTGSVALGGDGVWRLYYTALNSSGQGVSDQRIGLAESDDLETWHRVGDTPIVSPDPRWYRTLDGSAGPSETWRDPFVFRDPAGDGWHMLITARAPGAVRREDGVVGHARSDDMRTWEVGPPLCEPGAGFGQTEVSQVRHMDEGPLLVFTCQPDEQAGWRTAEFGMYCTWTVASGSMVGPWDLSGAQPFRAEPTLFAAPLVQRREGDWVFLGFRNPEPEGIVSLEIIDPIPVRRSGGALIVVPGIDG